MKSVSQLTELGFETTEIVVRKARGEKPEQKITIRGISTNDIMKLMRVHGAQILLTVSTVLAQAQAAADTDQSDEMAGKMILRLVEQVPDAITDLIVIVCDTPPEHVQAAFNVAQNFPIPLQLKVIQEVMRLTLEDFGGLGEFMETVLSLLGGMNGLMDQVRGLQSGLMTSSGSKAS